MKQQLDFDAAWELLIPRQALLLRGTGDRSLRASLARGELVRIRRGWYVPGDRWRELWPEGRHLVHVLAVARDARGTPPVFGYISAAVL